MKEKMETGTDLFRTEKIPKILLKIAPPVMLAQLIQAMYTVYIVILNAILAGFSDSAVTVLGLYYKMQTFFFIPLMGLQTCIVPVLSFNYATKSYGRCRETMKDSYLFSCGFMLIGGVVSCSFRWNCSGSFRTAVRSLQSEKRRFRSLDRVLFRRYFH